MPQNHPMPGEIYRHFKGNLYQIITIAVDAGDGSRVVVYQGLYAPFVTYTRPLEEFIDGIDYEKHPEATERYRFTLLSKAVVHRMAKEHEIQLEREREEHIIPEPDHELHIETERAHEHKAHRAKETAETNGPVHTLQLHMESAAPAANPVEVHRTETPENKKATTPVEVWMEETPAAVEVRMEDAPAPIEVQMEDTPEGAHLTENGTSQKPEAASDTLGLMMEFLDARSFEDKVSVLERMALQDDMNDIYIDNMAAAMDIVIDEGPIEKRFKELRKCVETRAHYELLRLRS